jgi:vacuolar-type H+-ATPase subunit I/STV1
MKRVWWLIIVGILVAAIGLVWTLQGLNVLGGSAMSGSSFWATVGPIVLIAGVALIVAGILVRRRGRSD